MYQPIVLPLVTPNKCRFEISGGRLLDTGYVHGLF